MCLCICNELCLDFQGGEKLPGGDSIFTVCGEHVLQTVLAMEVAGKVGLSCCLCLSVYLAWCMYYLYCAGPPTPFFFFHKESRLIAMLLCHDLCLS